MLSGGSQNWQLNSSREVRFSVKALRVLNTVILFCVISPFDALCAHRWGFICADVLLEGLLLLSGKVFPDGSSLSGGV